MRVTITLSVSPLLQFKRILVVEPGLSFKVGGDVLRHIERVTRSSAGRYDRAVFLCDVTRIFEVKIIRFLSFVGRSRPRSSVA